jgi:hypothetical protein
MTTPVRVAPPANQATAASRGVDGLSEAIHEAMRTVHVLTRIDALQTMENSGDGIPRTSRKWSAE